MDANIGRRRPTWLIDADMRRRRPIDADIRRRRANMGNQCQYASTKTEMVDET